MEENGREKTCMGVYDFALEVLGIRVYEYQRVVAEAIIKSVREKRGEIITVMFARQMGKNQVSAVVEAYLLAYCDHGTIVKAAPTADPQVKVSMKRLRSLLSEKAQYTMERKMWRAGTTIGLARDESGQKNKSGASITFLSADP